jgi:hypothetical protein
VVHFLQFVSGDVLMIRHLPYERKWATWEYYATRICANHIKNAQTVQAFPEWYIEIVLPILQRLAVATLVGLYVLDVPILVTKFLSHLSYLKFSLSLSSHLLGLEIFVLECS